MDKADDLKRALSEDVALRAAAIRLLARDYPKDFLEPVKIKGVAEGTRFSGELSSDKEWQE